MKNVLILNPEMVERNERLEDALMDYAAEFRAEDTTAEYQMDVAIDVLRAAKIDYVGGIVIPTVDGIEVLHGADKEAYLAEVREANFLGQLIGAIREKRAAERYALEIEEAIEEKVKKAANMMRLAKAGDIVAVSNINGLADMAAIITDMEMGAVINWRAKGTKGSAIAKAAGTGRRAAINYKLVERVNGELVFHKSIEEVSVVKAQIKKVANKQAGTVVYKEGDKGYTAPKGVPTQKREDVRPTNVVALPVEKKDSVVISFANLQLLASSNINNTISGGNNMERKVVSLERASVEVVCREFAGKTIRTHKQLNEVVQKGISTVCEKPVVNKIVVDPTVGIDGIGNTKVVRTIGTNSPMSCAFEYKNVETTVEIENYTLRVGGDTLYKITTDYVFISCGECETDVQQALLDRIINFGLYKQGKTIFFPEYNDNKELVALREGSPYGKEVEGDINAIINDTRVAYYVFFNASPSQERNADLVGIDARKYNEEARFRILDELMGNGISYAISYKLTKADKEAIMNGAAKLSDFPTFTENFTKKEAMKLPTRVAQQNTASMYLNTVGNDKYGVLYLNTALTGGEDFIKEVKDALDAEYGVEIDNQITDGQAFGLENIVIDAFEEHGVTVKRSAVRGSAFQMRTEGLNDKVFVSFYSRKVLNRIVKNIESKYRDMKDKEGRPVIHIIGNPDNIAYVVDGNAAKLPNFWRMNREDADMYGVEYGNFKMAILAPASSSNAKLSLQALGKIKSDATESMVCTNFYNMLGKSLERIIMGKVAVDGKTARTQKFFAANEDRSTSSASIHEMLLKEVADQGMSCIRKISVPVKGLNLRALFDNTHLVTGKDELSVLKVVDGKVQAYSKSVCDLNRVELAKIYAEYTTKVAELIAMKDAGDLDEEGLRMALVIAKAVRTEQTDKVMTSYTIKYPCPTDIEFAVFRYLAWFEVEEAIAELACCDYDKELLTELYSNLKDGIVMIAPLNTVKHRLAGMDTDYDGVTSFFEEVMVEAAVNNDKGDVVIIDKAEGEESLSPYRPGSTIKPQANVSEITIEEDTDSLDF